MAEGLKVLRAVECRLPGVTFECTEHPVGAQEFLRNGDPLPEPSFLACRQADAVLLGAMGLPQVRRPNGKELTPQIDLRERLDLYAGVRPVRLFHENDSVLKKPQAGEIDFVLVRESTEGLFAERSADVDPEAGEICDVLRITRHGAERVCRAAFRIAQRRRQHVTLVDKANVLPSMVFFRSVFDEVAREFPQVAVDHTYVDAAALFFVRCPERFDVLVTENMFGDILSDLSAGLVGGMGMAPSGDIGDHHAVFQPAHGSAPDIAGRGLANPIAMILSVAMLLEWLDHPATARGSAWIRRAVEHVLSDPRQRTPDLGGELTTVDLGDAVINALGEVIQ
jgi:3-isopropylmalate dehydrogenase